MRIYEHKIKPKNKFEVRTGDVLLVKSKTGLLGHIINFLSGSKFIHSAILIEIKGLWFVIETRYSKRYAYQMMPIEWWFARHPKEDAYVGRMPNTHIQENSEKKIRNILMDSMEAVRPYKMRWLALVYLLQVWFGVFRPQVSRLFRGCRPLICSTLVQEAWERAGLIKRSNYMTPGDIVKLVGGEKALIPLQNDRQIKRRTDVRTNSDEEANNTELRPIAI